MCQTRLYTISCRNLEPSCYDAVTRLQVRHVYDTRKLFDCACAGSTSGGVLLRDNVGQVVNTVVDLPLLPSSVMLFGSGDGVEAGKGVD